MQSATIIRAVTFVGCLLLYGSCTYKRTPLEEGTGVHPEGFGTKTHDNFHGAWLQKAGYPLQDCQYCHGDDFGGGAVAYPCSNEYCHTKEPGVGFCGTCHGDTQGPLPTSTSHTAHKDIPCDTCHSVPATLAAENHLNGITDVLFNRLAKAHGATPEWSTETMQCSNTYCHGDTSPTWDGTSTNSCDTCHGKPPVSHAPFQRVAATCDTCHTIDAVHPDGAVNLLADLSCDTCHGERGRSSPPVDLEGGHTPSSSGVGAHAIHLDATLVGRIGRAVACERCHQVPSAITTPGHLQETTPGDVYLPLNGTYFIDEQRCAVWCHWDQIPGPAWTDVSGQARACDGCHAFAPVRTRTGTFHPPVPDPTLSACQSCHPFEPARHVNGVVDLAP